MTVYELMTNYENKQHGHFFDKDTLKFFGERLSEMYVYKAQEIKKDYLGNKHKCWCLKSIQHNAPTGRNKVKYTYFDTDTFEIIG